MDPLQTAHVSSATAIDPFYLYMHLVQELGEGRVFLLDAAREAADSEYRMSLLGVVPVLEIQVKDGEMTVFSVTGLGSAVNRELAGRGYRSVAPVHTVDAVSAIVGERWTYRPADPMLPLEEIRQLLKGRSRLYRPPFASGLFGYIGYDAVHYLEQIPATTEDDRLLPDVRLQWFAGVAQLTDTQAHMYFATDILESLVSVRRLTRLRVNYSRLLLPPTRSVSILG